jgi:polyhydroxyalkanoate synthesis regulator phasin
MKFSLRDSRLASVGLASVIAVGVIGVGSVVMAQEGSGDTTTPSTQTTPPLPGDDCLGPVARIGPGIVLRNLGITPEEIQEAAAAGLTNAQTIDQYGDKSSAEAKADALAALEEGLARAVENGKLTQERADAILADAPAKLDEFLAAPTSELGKGMKRGFGGIGQNVLATVAEVLGTDEDTLKTQLKDGSTIAEIAGDQAQAVIDALVADASEHIDQAVADGKLTQERADQLKENLAERITTMVNEGPRLFDRGHREGMRGGMRGFPGQGFGGGRLLPFDAQ